MKVSIFVVFCLLFGGVFSRLPPKNQETEQAAPTAVENNNPPKESPPSVNPVDNPTATNDQSTGSIDTNARKPMVILFRQRPAFSLFSDRSSNPFAPLRPSLLDSPFHNLHHGSSLHDDPAIRLISLLMGNPRIRPMQPESSDESNESTSAESSAEETNVRDVHPFERLFPSIFPRFPIDDHDHDKEPSSSNDDKTPVNFENKEKKVVNIDGRKFVKTTQVKKVKNDFGQFHSVISSYQPFDENIHDENGNEKIKPSDSEDSKISSTVEKKDVQPPNPVVEDEKVDIVPLTSSSTTSSTTTTSTSTSTSAPVEKEEVTSTESSVSDKSSSVTPDDDDDDTTEESKEPERLVSTSESSNKDNEIPDKNTELKVDQMN